MIGDWRHALWRKGGFAVILAIAATLSLVRGFAAAAILAPAAFGIYALIIAVGSFFSSLLGFGRVEAARKIFPRLLIDGHPQEMLRAMDQTTLLLTIRIILATSLIGVVCAVVGRSDLILPVVLGGGIAFGVGWSVVLASAQRAGTDLSDLAHTALLRAILALMLGILGAYLWGWPGIVAAELVAALAGNVVARWRLRMASANAVVVAPREVAAEGRPLLWDRGGQLLFIAFTALSIPLYLGRPYVAAVFSAFELGQFSFVMLFVTAAATAATILDQKIGPQLVRMERSGVAYREQRRYLAKWSFGAALAIAIGMAAAALFLFNTPLQYYAARYSLSLNLMLPVALLAAAQVTTTFDWMLQSQNREAAILGISLFSTGVFALGCLCVALSGLPLAALLWVMAAAKLVQLCLQVALIQRAAPGPAQRAAPSDIAG